MTLKYRSKVKYEYISSFLGYDFLYPDNTIFCSKTNSKEVILSIEIVIFHTFAFSEALTEKYRSQEVASNKLEKDPLRDNKTVFFFTCGTCGSEEDFLKI
jgi:hypothetical protein